MARKRLVGIADATSFKLYVCDLLNDSNRSWQWFKSGGYQFSDEVAQCDHVKACPLYDQEALKKHLKHLPEGQTELGGEYAPDPYQLEELITPALMDGKNFDDLYKAFCNKQRQQKNRVKNRRFGNERATKKIDVRVGAARIFDRAADGSGKNKLDTIDDIAVIIRILCDEHMTVIDLRRNAHGIKDMLEAERKKRRRKNSITG